jgi:hypothetical protein
MVLAATLSVIDLTPREPNLPVFGPGKLVNVFDSDAALTNASAHVAWSLALPLAGKAVGGRKGMWIAGTTWMAWTIVNESFFHAPPRPGRSYPAEVRADLLTRLVPCAMVLAWDLVQHRP